MSYNIALVSAAGISGGSYAGACLDDIRDILEQSGHTVTEVLDANISTTDFSSYDLAIVCQSGATAANIESDIDLPCLLMTGNLSTGTGQSWPGSLLDLTTTVETKGNASGGNTITVSSGAGSHAITSGWSGDLTVASSYGTFSSPSALEGSSPGTDYVGTLLLEGVSGGYFAGDPIAIAVESGTSKLTSGTTSHRYVLFTYARAPYYLSGRHEVATQGFILRSLCWLLDDMGAIDTGISDSGANETFAGESLGSLPADWTFVAGTDMLQGSLDYTGLGFRAARANASGQGYYTFDNSSSETDKDIYCHYFHSQTGNHDFRIHVKGRKYYLNLQNDNVNSWLEISLWDYNGGSPSQIGSTVNKSSMGWADIDRHWFWVRFQVYDDGATCYLKAKVWRGFHRDEPAGWDIEQTNATYFGTSGVAGVEISYGGSATNSWAERIDQFLESGELGGTYTKTVSLDGAIQKQGNTLSVGLDAQIQNPEARVTQLGKLVMGYGEDILKVTQLGKQILWKQEIPYQPSITDVDVGTPGQVTINSSAYYSPEGEAHAHTQYQVQLAGGDWSSIVWDSGTLGAVETKVWTGYSYETSYQVRVRYQDAEGDWSDWSLAYYFVTGSSSGTGVIGDFDMADWAQIWNIGNARYYEEYLGPGGWHKVGGFRDQDDDCSNGYGSAGYSADAKVVGNVGAFGRLLGPPGALVNTSIGANNGVNVAGKFLFFSSEGGFSWQRFYDVELAQAGLVACACGTVEPTNPALTWNPWLATTPGDWVYSSDFQGVFAYIDAGLAWPYDVCCSGDCQPCSDGYVRYAGSLPGPQLWIEVFFEGRMRQAWYMNIPKTLYPSSSRRVCANCGLPYWACDWFPWHSLRLKFWHDYDADPTGKTHRIQVAWGASDTGKLEADLPPSDGPWDLDKTWVGGHEETTPGSGDGGLRAGWTGYGSSRWTGAVTTRTTGVTNFKDLTVEVLDTSFTATPCDANYITETPPSGVDPPVGEPEPSPILQPCPPDQDTSDKELFLGGKDVDGSLYRFGGYEIQAGNQIVARVRPNPIAPEGYAGACLFTRMTVALEHFSDIQVSIVPVLNGERLDQYAMEKTYIGAGDRWTMRRFEVPLYRAFEDAVVEGTEDDRFKYGLRGTFFTFEMEIVDLCGVGLQLPGVWVEYEPLRAALAKGVVYTEDLLVAPVFVPSGQVFMGTKGQNRLLKAASGTTDNDSLVQARMFSNPVAPEGEAGECEFREIDLVVTRWNGNPMDLLVTPYIDGVALGPITINYKATTAPVTEITPIDLAIHYQRQGADAIERFRYRKRGAWIHVKVETDTGLEQWLTVEGATVIYDVVRESLQEDVR